MEEWNSSTVKQRHCVAARQCLCFTVPLFHSSSVFLFHCAFVTLCHFFTLSVPPCHSPLSLFLCATVPVCICSTVSLFHCASVTLCLCSTVPLFHCVCVPLCLCCTVSLFHCATVSLCICSTVPLSSVSVPLCHCYAVFLFYCFTVSQFHCATDEKFCPYYRTFTAHANSHIAPFIEHAPGNKMNNDRAADPCIWLVNLKFELTIQDSHASHISTE